MERFTSSVLRILLILAALWVQGRAQNPPVKQNQPVDVIRINTELIQTGVIVLDKQGHESRDAARIPFGGEIALDSIPSGQYTLEITVEDQFAKTSASQHTRITIE